MKFHTFLRIFRSFPIFLYGESYNLASFRFKLHIFVRYIIQMGRFSSPNQVFCMKYHTLQSGETVNVTGTVRIPDTPGWRSIDMTGLGYEPPYTPGWRSINVTGSVRTALLSRLERSIDVQLGTNCRKLYHNSISPCDAPTCSAACKRHVNGLAFTQPTGCV
jgi:hypothetical protein